MNKLKKLISRITFSMLLMFWYSLIGLCFVFIDDLVAQTGQSTGWVHLLAAKDAEMLVFLSANLLLLSVVLHYQAERKGEAASATVISALVGYAAAVEFFQPINAAMALAIIVMAYPLVIGCMFLMIKSWWWRIFILLLFGLAFYDTRTILLLGAIIPLEAVVGIVMPLFATIVVVGICIWFVFKSIESAGSYNIFQQPNRRERRRRKR